MNYHSDSPSVYYMFVVTSNGGLHTYYGNGFDSENLNIRPSVVLKSTVSATTEENIDEYGEPGTHTNPYVVN